MYDFDDGEIGLEAFGRVSRDGGAATTTTTTLGGATRFARSSIFHRIASVSAMMVFVRGGMLLPSRFFETTVGSGSPFSMTSLMSTSPAGRRRRGRRHERVDGRCVVAGGGGGGEYEKLAR